MKITKRSPFTGTTNTLEVPITAEQYNEFMSQQGRSIQDIMPEVDPGLREFMMTGITPKEWDETFSEEEG